MIFSYALMARSSVLPTSQLNWRLFKRRNLWTWTVVGSQLNTTSQEMNWNLLSVVGTMENWAGFLELTTTKFMMIWWHHRVALWSMLIHSSTVGKWTASAVELVTFWVNNEIHLIKCDKFLSVKLKPINAIKSTNGLIWF